jgi:hypothetical protein
VNPFKATKKKQEMPEKFEGWIKKCSPNWFVGYQKRWARVEDLVFWYFEHEDDLKPNGYIDFREVVVNIEASLNKPSFILHIKGNKKVFELKAESNAVKDQWVRAITSHLDHKDSRKVKSNAEFFNQDNWWRIPQISEANFVSRVDSGDVLLFTTKNFVAGVQRTFTGSDIDHVAMLLRYNSNEIVLLESTGNLGVSLCRWSLFIQNRWQLLYKKIVWRKLHFKRRQKFIENLEGFIKNVVGKKYELSAGKLFGADAKDDLNDLNDKDRGYFCSELIAAAYKALDLLPKQKGSNKYWPGDFCQSKMYKLNNEATLGPEFRVNFTL